MTVLEVSWPDDSFFTRILRPDEMNTVVEVPHPLGAELTPLANDTQVVGRLIVQSAFAETDWVYGDKTCLHASLK